LVAWKAADVGFFDPSLPDNDGVEVVGHVTYYTNVETFIDRLRDLATLKSEEVVRANVHSCLKGIALKWYTHELARDTKDIMQATSLEAGWYKLLAKRFRPSRSEALSRLENTKFG